MNERNDYGYPVIDRHQAARDYAAQVRERNQQECERITCKQIELLPAVQRILVNWGI
jgi:hypothetical protein